MCKHLGMYRDLLHHMKQYTTETRDTCWNDSLACILGVNPKLVPNFVKLYKNDYMDKTREWLEENFGKGLVYIPARAFMETSRTRNNSPIGPSGYSIIYLTMVTPTANHAAVAYNGGIVWDNGDSREDEYGEVKGYYVLYDLDPEAVRWKRGKKPKVKTVKKKNKNERKSK
jgi:hypothetical protein